MDLISVAPFNVLVISFTILLAVAKASLLGPLPSIAPYPTTDSSQYNYAYGVSDPITGDSKSAVESKEGDVVIGSYSLVEPDGRTRIVDYRADDVNGFSAVVRRTPLSGIVNVSPVARVAPLVQSVPVQAVAPARNLAASVGYHYSAPPVRALAAVSDVAYSRHHFSTPGSQFFYEAHHVAGPSSVTPVNPIAYSAPLVRDHYGLRQVAYPGPYSYSYSV